MHIPSNSLQQQQHASSDANNSDDYRPSAADLDYNYTDVMLEPTTTGRQPDTAQGVMRSYDGFPPQHTSQQAGPGPSPVLMSTSPHAIVDEIGSSGASNGNGVLSTDGSLLLKPGSTAPPTFKLREWHTYVCVCVDIMYGCAYMQQSGACLISLCACVLCVKMHTCRD